MGRTLLAGPRIAIGLHTYSAEYLGTTPDLESAYAKFYKSGRLNASAEMRAAILKSSAADMQNSDGNLFCIASRHDSNTGNSIFAREVPNGVEVYALKSDDWA